MANKIEGKNDNPYDALIKTNSNQFANKIAVAEGKSAIAKRRMDKVTGSKDMDTYASLYKEYLKQFPTEDKVTELIDDSLFMKVFTCNPATQNECEAAIDNFIIAVEKFLPGLNLNADQIEEIIAKLKASPSKDSVKTKLESIRTDYIKQLKEKNKTPQELRDERRSKLTTYKEIIDKYVALYQTYLNGKETDKGDIFLNVLDCGDDVCPDEFIEEVTPNLGSIITVDELYKLFEGIRNDAALKDRVKTAIQQKKTALAKTKGESVQADEAKKLEQTIASLQSAKQEYMDLYNKYAETYNNKIKEFKEKYKNGEPIKSEGKQTFEQAKAELLELSQKITSDNNAFTDVLKCSTPEECLRKKIDFISKMKKESLLQSSQEEDFKRIIESLSKDEASKNDLTTKIDPIQSKIIQDLTDLTRVVITETSGVLGKTFKVTYGGRKFRQRGGAISDEQKKELDNFLKWSNQFTNLPPNAGLSPVQGQITGIQGPNQSPNQSPSQDPNQSPSQGSNQGKGKDASSSSDLSSILEQIKSLHKSQTDEVTGKTSTEINALTKIVMDILKKIECKNTDDACKGASIITPKRLEKLTTDSYAQTIEYLKLFKAIIEKRKTMSTEDEKTSNTTEADVILKKINQAIDILMSIGKDNTKMVNVDPQTQEKINASTSDIMELLLTMLGIGATTAAIAGGKRIRSTKKRMKYRRGRKTKKRPRRRHR